MNADETCIHGVFEGCGIMCEQCGHTCSQHDRDGSCCYHEDRDGESCDCDEFEGTPG